MKLLATACMVTKHIRIVGLVRCNSIDRHRDRPTDWRPQHNLFNDDYAQLLRINAANAIVWCPSVCLTFVYSIETNKYIFKIVSTMSGHATSFSTACSLDLLKQMMRLVLDYGRSSNVLSTVVNPVHPLYGRFCCKQASHSTKIVNWS